MKVLGFSFKREAVWLLVFAIAPAVLGVLVMLIVLMFRK